MSGTGVMEPMARGLQPPEANGHGRNYEKKETTTCGGGSGGGGEGRRGYFQMPLHYPRYSKEEYETMPEWKLDRLLAEYGLPVAGDLAQKRSFAMGAFLWTPY